MNKSKNININNKRICILRSNPVNPDSRVEKEAWTLKLAGYDVHILAWNRDSNSGEMTESIYVGNEEVPITRLGYKATFGEGFKNIIPYMKFQLHMRRWLNKNRFDVIHACDFDTAFFSIGIAKKHKIKFVFDIFDFLYGEPQNLMEKLVKHAQISIINNSSATIICSEDRRKQISESRPNKLAVIHNTPALVHITDSPLRTNPTDRVKIVYVGILQDYRLLNEIAQVISESDDLELHIGGFGKYGNFFEEISKKSENIYYYGRLSYDQTLALEKECDIMLAIYDPTIENHRYAAPNKFYESLFVGKPVVMVKGTGMSTLVSKHDIGVLIDYTKESFKEGIDYLIDKRESWEEMSARMKILYFHEYSWDIMSNRLTALYKDMLEN